MFVLLIVFIGGRKCENTFLLREHLQAKIGNELPFRRDYVLRFMMLEWNHVVHNGKTPNSSLPVPFQFQLKMSVRI